MMQLTARADIDKAFPIKMKFQSGKEMIVVCKGKSHQPEFISQ
ncbi:MAG: hypothetical protein ACC635_02955 [Acidiferrobacterales bacterium]